MTDRPPGSEHPSELRPSSAKSSPTPGDSLPDGFSRLPSPIKRGMSQGRIPALDGVRTIAVFLVILMHYGIPGVPGSYGVVAFFVLSGFLITWLLLKEQRRFGRISIPGFYKRRTLRIFPAFYAYWIGWTGLVVLTGRQVTWPHAWSAFFYYSNYYNAILGDPNTAYSHTWSLAIEEQFYLLWPAAFLFLSVSQRRLERSLGVIISFVWLYRIALVLLGVDQAYRYAAFDTRFDALMVGCLLAVVLWNGSFAGLWRLALRNPVAPLIVLLGIILGIYGNAVLNIGSYEYRDSIGHALVPVLMAIMIVQLIAFSGHGWWSWIDSWPFRYLGTISYPLYLYQQVTTDSVRRALDFLPPLAQFLATMGITIFVASLSYYVIEKPFLRLKRVDLLSTGRYWARKRLNATP